MTARSGIGVDVHPLVEGRRLVLGGVTVPFDRGLAAHSDGDVLIHAVIDALLGGAALGDIGAHFPSSDPENEGVASTDLLRQTCEMLARRRWRAIFVDATIIAEKPAMRPFADEIQRNLADCLGLGAESVNIKATTTDGLGLIGRGEGIASLAIATLEQVT